MLLNYNEEELNLLANTPHLIGSAMAFVGNSGLFGTGKEMFVNAQAIMAGIKDYPDNKLIKAILPDSTGDATAAMEKIHKVREWGISRYKAKKVDSAEKFIAETIEDCKAVNSLLVAKASQQEATEYKQWTISIAEKVAVAATEGGFLGFGGERFSQNEKILFSQIQNALGYSNLLA